MMFSTYRSFFAPILILWLFHSTPALSINNNRSEEYISSCKADFRFLTSQLKKNSAPFANKQDHHFHIWFKKGYVDTLKLIDAIGDPDDCYYALKYYLNGFKNSHITVTPNITMPKLQYPGILTMKNASNEHLVIHKNEKILYLDNVSIGDKLTHINGIHIDEYHKDYLLPFYSHSDNKKDNQATSLHAMILDGNKFKPVPQIAKFLSPTGRSYEISLRYHNLAGSALEVVKHFKMIKNSDEFKVESISKGIWIKIPSFYIQPKNISYYIAMLGSLSTQIAKKDYILFDLRGNQGGRSHLSTAIIRNLWGDKFIQSLGTKHDYNLPYTKKLRVSKDNFVDFKKSYSNENIVQYVNLLKNDQDYYSKTWSVYQNQEGLYTNLDNNKVKSKIYVLTDRFCSSVCLRFTRELRQMPNVVHLGNPTSSHSLYSYAKEVATPSNQFDFFYPTQMHVAPSYPINSQIIPDIIYTGDSFDEASIIDWILSITEK